MKTLLLVSSFALTVQLTAQPVINDFSKRPANGTTTPIYTSTGTTPGNAGANQTWDFSTLSFTNSGLTWTVVDPASTPYLSNYPTANYAWTFSQGSTKRYFYYEFNATKLETIADNMAAPGGSGNDYSPDHLQLMKFPFNFGDSFQDTYKKTGGAQGTATVIYDGYGTLKTSTTTYPNVWRTKEDKGGGLVNYSWYTVNPVQLVMSYNASNNSITLFGTADPSGIAENNLASGISIYPQPASEELTFTAKELKNIALYNSEGKLVVQAVVTDGAITVDISTLANGIYVYKARNGEKISVGKVVITK